MRKNKLLLLGVGAAVAIGAVVAYHRYSNLDLGRSVTKSMKPAVKT